MKNFSIHALLFCIVAASSLSGCGKAASHKEIDIASSAIPGADMVCVIDIKAIKESSLVKNSGKNEAKKPGKLQQATGLDDKSILNIVITADLGSITMSNQTGTATLPSLMGMAIMHLSTNISMDQLRSGIKAIADERTNNIVITESKIDERPVLHISQAGTNDLPGYFSLSNNGKDVLMTLNEKSMALALAGPQRDADQNIVKLVAAERTIPRESQIRMAITLNDATRSRISEQISGLEAGKKDKKTAVILSFIKPFENVRSVMFNATLATNVMANLAADLGSEEQAMQAKNTIELVLIPALLFSVGDAGGALPANLAQRIEIINSGSFVNLGLKFSEGDLTALINSQPITAPPVPQNSK